MPKRQRRQNGTRISLSNPPSSTTAVATAAETLAVENNGSESPEIANAARGERRLAVRAALPPALADDIDDVSSTHSNTADGSNDSSDESYAPDSSGMHQRPKKPSAMRGARPNGFSYEAASKIDFSSSYSIHKHMPPYKGRGQLPFPTQSLLDSRGNVNPNLKFCWSKVADWRRMTAKQQKLSWKFELDLDGELKKREKMLAEKEQRDAKKREKAVRKAINDANRTNNRRKKRQAERDAAREAIAEGGEEEEEDQVSLYSCFIV